MSKNYKSSSIKSMEIRNGVSRKVHCYNRGWILSKLNDEFTVKDLMNITGQTYAGARLYIDKRLVKYGFAISKYGKHRGLIPATYIKTTPVAQTEQTIVEPNTLSSSTTEQILAELKSRGYDITLHVM